MVGATGFEPATSCTPSKRASQAAPRPDWRGHGYRGHAPAASMQGSGSERTWSVSPPGGVPRAMARCGRMARPARTLWITRAYARRRHRSWHLAMMLATLGWGTWWCVLLLHRLAPERELSLALPAALSSVAAVLGLLVALLTLRARRSWILFALVPLFANGSLLFVPWLAEAWRNRS